MVNWLSFSQLSGSGNTDVTVTASTYSDLMDRVTSICVSGISKSVDIPVMQYGRYGPHPEDYYGNYLTFEILTGGTIVWCCQVGNSEYQKTIEYRINGGAWTSITSKQPASTTASTIDPSCVFSVSAGDIVEWRGTNNQYGYRADGSGVPVYYAHFAGSAASNYGGTATYSVYGNIMSLVYGDNFEGNDNLTAHCAFLGLFCGSNAVFTHNLDLPAMSMTKHCYEYMFAWSHRLITSPSLPATTLTTECYTIMFNHCEELLVPPPILPATTLGSWCYNGMFSNCSSLVSTPVIAAEVLSDYSCAWMFSNCTSITKAGPLLPAASTPRGYYHIFDGCTNLSEITCLLTSTTNRDYCLSDWVLNVSPTGVFYKLSYIDWPSGNNGIPTGWSVQNV